MSIFFHHVGAIGSSSDFPKTVIKANGDLVGRSFAELEPHMSEFSSVAIDHFRQEATSESRKTFQVWGIPSGGERALSKLDVGDYFLLLPDQKMGSRFRYLGKVIARAPRQSFALSRYLWQSDNFPIIFLMQGQGIDYPWEDFRRALGYGARWRLMGKSFRVTEERLAQSPFGSEAGLIKALQEAAVTSSDLENKGLGFSETQSDFDNISDALSFDIEEIMSDGRRQLSQKLALVSARIGQGKFRRDVLSRFGACCAVTGCTVSETLRASHIKPWRESSDEERLDPENGLPLIANLDALFDRYLITFDERGKILTSISIEEADRAILISSHRLLRKLSGGQQSYLAHHRSEFLKRDQIDRRKSSSKL